MKAHKIFGSSRLILIGLLLLGGLTASAVTYADSIFTPAGIISEGSFFASVFTSPSESRISEVAVVDGEPASVRTNKAHYSPGDTAKITGENFGANEVVTLQVTHTDGLPNTGGGHEPWTANTDESGFFTTTWYVDPDDSLDSTFLLTAESATASASATFSDPGPSADLDQCRNGSAADPNDCVGTGSGGSGWVNGNVGAQQGHFIEGYSIPYRMRMEDLTPGSYTLDMGYDTIHSGAHAIDFLTHYDSIGRTNTTPTVPLHNLVFGHGAECIDPSDSFISEITNSDNCNSPPPQGVTPSDTHPIPKPVIPDGVGDVPPCNINQYTGGAVIDGATSCPGATFDAIADAGQAYMTMWNGNITGIEYVQGQQNVNTGGDKQHTMIRVYFTVTQDDIDADDGNVALGWGGHIGRRQDWGTDNSAGGISGSPYHMNLHGLCAGSTPNNGTLCTDGGAQDRSLSAAAVFVTGSITIIKDADPDDEQDFAYTTTGSGLENFSLDDDGDNTNTLSSTKTFTGIVSGTYTVTETLPVAGWTLTNLECDDPNGGTSVNETTGVATIGISAGETVVCTYTNTSDNLTKGRIVIVKDTIPNDSQTFTFTPTYPGVPPYSGGQFTLFDDGSGTGNSNDSCGAGDNCLDPGNQSVTETPNADYETTASCPDVLGESFDATTGTLSNIPVAAGQTTTCTFTNRKKPKLRLLKATVPTNDDGKFDLRDGGVVKADEVGNGGDSGFFNTTTGSHTVSEVAGSTSPTTLADYASKVVCDSSKGSADPGTSHTFSLDYGDVVTCTFTNSRLPKLKLVKATVPTTDDGKFDLRDGGVVKADEVGNGGNSGFYVTTIGSHTVDELIGSTSPTVLADYASKVECDSSKGSANPGTSHTFNLAYGDVVTCTFTNSRLPRLKLVKATVPTTDDGKFDLRDGGVVKADEVGNGGNSGFYNTTTGSHTVSELIGSTSPTTLADYNSKVECDSGKGSADPGTSHTFSLAYGDVVTCTFTNSRLPRLKLVKATVPTTDDGKFDLRDGGVVKADEVGNGGNSGFYNTTTGSHTVSELIGSTSPTTLADYASKVECDSSKGSADPGTSHTFSLAYGDVVTCTFTNSRLPRLKLVKATVPTTDDGKFDLRDGGVVKADEVGNGGNSGFYTTTIGSHTVSELIGSTSPTTLADYASKVECDSSKGSADPGTSHTFSLAYGDVVTCTFTNSRLPRIRLIKDVAPNSDTGVFDLSDSVEGLLVDDGGDGASSGFVNTDTGSHTVSEAGGTGTSLANYDSKVVCDSSKGSADPGTSHTFSLAYGDAVTCTFTNSRLPRLRLLKVTNPADDPGKFDLRDNGAVKADEVGNGGDSGFFNTTTGAHTVSELAGSTSSTTLANYVSKVECNSSKGSNDPGTSHSFSLAYGDLVTCTFTNTRKGHLELEKFTNGQVRSDIDIDFRLYRDGVVDGDLSGDEVLLETLSTLGDLDGNLVFGEVPPGNYTVCEYPVPVSYTSKWTINGSIVTPYNPEGNDVPMQDLGNRCYDFSIAAGETVSIHVDNDFPGGDPRTIGYWKNWNRCTGGGQANNADANGGTANGFWLVEDVLPQTIGDLVVTNCQDAVDILDKSSLDGKKRANDAAYELASQFLAARFNLAAGAETCTALEQAVIDAQALLDLINFTGNGAYLESKVKTPVLIARRNQALQLARTLDQYNNGLLCSP